MLRYNVSLFRSRGGPAILAGCSLTASPTTRKGVSRPAAIAHRFTGRWLVRLAFTRRCWLRCFCLPAARRCRSPRNRRRSRWCFRRRKQQHPPRCRNRLCRHRLPSQSPCRHRRNRLCDRKTNRRRSRQHHRNRGLLLHNCHRCPRQSCCQRSFRCRHHRRRNRHHFPHATPRRHTLLPRQHGRPGLRRLPRRRLKRRQLKPQGQSNRRQRRRRRRSL